MIRCCCEHRQAHGWLLHGIADGLGRTHKVLTEGGENQLVITSDVTDCNQPKDGFVRQCKIESMKAINKSGQERAVINGIVMIWIDADAAASVLCMPVRSPVSMSVDH